MPEPPDPAVLYPEVAAHGSLAAAIQALAAEQGLSLAMTVTPSDPLRHATVSSVLPHRGTLFVSAATFERRWWVQGTADNGPLISGVTHDLRHVPEVVLGWVEGASLAEIGRVARFDTLTGRLEVPDGDPTALIDAEWPYLLKDAREADWPEYRALIEAAHAEPRLRRFYPFTSHHALSFSATPRPDLGPTFATVEAPRDGGDYTVREWWDGPVVAEVGTVAEAISVAVARIPDGSGGRVQR